MTSWIITGGKEYCERVEEFFKRLITKHKPKEVVVGATYVIEARGVIPPHHEEGIYIEGYETERLKRRKEQRKGKKRKYGYK